MDAEGQQLIEITQFKWRWRVTMIAMTTIIVIMMTLLIWLIEICRFLAQLFLFQHDQFCEDTVLVAKEEEADEGGEQGRRCPCREASSTTTRKSPQKSQMLSDAKATEPPSATVAKKWPMHCIASLGTARCRLTSDLIHTSSHANGML